MMKLLSFHPALLVARPLRLPVLNSTVEETALTATPFEVVATLLVGALICAAASALYLILIHPASARFDEQWQLGFALAVLAWVQATVAVVYSLRGNRGRTAD